MKTLDTKVKDWYSRQFPTDTSVINDMSDCTFREIADNPDMVYDLINIGQSDVREAIFVALTDITGKDYDYYYYKWLGLEKPVPEVSPEFPDVRITECVTKNKNGHESKITILVGGVSSANPKEYMDRAVRKYINDKPHNQFIVIELDNPWTRIVTSGVGDYDFVPFINQTL
jgi:hypothetical protein